MLEKSKFICLNKKMSATLVTRMIIIIVVIKIIGWRGRWEGGSG